MKNEKNDPVSKIWNEALQHTGTKKNNQRQALYPNVIPQESINALNEMCEKDTYSITL